MRRWSKRGSAGLFWRGTDGSLHLDVTFSHVLFVMMWRTDSVGRVQVVCVVVCVRFQPTQGRTGSSGDAHEILFFPHAFSFIHFSLLVRSSTFFCRFVLWESVILFDCWSLLSTLLYLKHSTAVLLKAYDLAEVLNFVSSWFNSNLEFVNLFVDGLSIRLTINIIE